jgi:hypothetical protein
MCTELILASIYFFTIFLINFFLFKLITTNLPRFYELKKIKVIFDLFRVDKKFYSFYSLITLKQEFQNQKDFSIFEEFWENEDLLLFGSFFAFVSRLNFFLLSENFGKIKKNRLKKTNNFLSVKIYFELLKNHYLIFQQKFK